MINAVAAFLFAPLLLGLVRRTKAMFAGRTGAPLLQTYFDLAKLLRRGAVYSDTTTWVFGTGPVLGLAATVIALALVPLGGVPSLVHFSGDLIALVYLLAIPRFMTVLAALDTGSAFEGMGASREVQFAALAEPAFLIALIALVRTTGDLSLTSIYAALNPHAWGISGGGLVLICAALAVVFLAENARIPFDDPTTHLELTMIHEVMVLDHGGPDLALIEWTSALKLWILGSLLVGVAVPVRTGGLVLDALAGLVALMVLSVLVGIVESSMARLRLLRVPQMLLGASVLAVAGLFLIHSAGAIP